MTTAPTPRQRTIPLVGFSGKDTPSSAEINSCVHCGLCLAVCPTYRETGLEMASPRGRIYLMKAVGEGRLSLASEVFQAQMSQCLNCRACEAVCPSGVPYGSMLEASRVQLEQAKARGVNSAPATRDEAATDDALPPRPLWQRGLRGAVFGALFKNMALFRAFSSALKLYQQSGAQTVARASSVIRRLGLADAEAMLPPMSGRFVIPQGQSYPAEGVRRYSVVLFTGCIMGTAFAHVHAATIRVLQKNGCEVILPPDQGCCGALHTHGGDLDGGRALARRNLAAFAGMGLDAIIVNAAGCGSTLKEYGHLLQDEEHERGAAFSNKVKDIYEFLAGIELNTAALGRLDLTVTYQEPCHLAHAQRITAQPRKLLAAIPGLELREMQESSLCCGSAGVYNVTQPALAAQLGARKINHALATGAHVIATGNPGCALQLVSELRRRGATVEVRALVELLDASYQQGAGARGQGAGGMGSRSS